ncbi:MAG: hypothetical protein AAFR01_10435 [Pseudomonadota bacterium]
MRGLNMARGFLDALRDLLAQSPLIVAGELLAILAFGAGTLLLLFVGAVL